MTITATAKEYYITIRGDRIEAKLQTRVNLVDNSRVSVISPITASLRHDIWNLHLVGDIRRVNEQVDVHALANVPGNVTVERPETPVVKLDLNNEVAVGLDELSIATLRVRRVCDGDTVPSSETLTEDLHVEAMNVHGICGIC